MEYVAEEDDDQLTTYRSDTSTESSVETRKEYSSYKPNNEIHIKCESESEESEDVSQSQNPSPSPSPNRIELQRIALRRELERSHRQNTDESRRVVAAQTHAEWVYQRELDTRLRLYRSHQARRFERQRRNRRFADKCCGIVEALMSLIVGICILVGINCLIRFSATAVTTVAN